MMTPQDYIARGWSIFPVWSVEGDRCTCGKVDCKNQGKHPRTLHGHKDSSDDPATIERWKEMFGPETNWAARCGFDYGYVVLDLDPRNNGDLKSLPFALPATLTAATGGGGRHYYFRPPRAIPKRPSFKPGIDFQGEDSYVLLPPSRHLSGQVYTWLDDRTPIADMPDWLVDMLETESTSPIEIEMEGPLGVGERNETLFKIACRLRRQTGDNWHSVMGAVQMHNTRCVEPLPNNELEALVRSAFNQDHTDVPPAINIGTHRTCTDDGNALRLVDWFGDDIRYARDLRVWFVWDGTRFRRGADTVVLDLARQMARRILDEASAETNTEIAGRLGKWASQSLGAAKIKAAVDLARSDERVSVSSTDFDSDPMLLNCPNGTVEISATGAVLREHRRSDLISQCTAVPYIADADGSWWRSWVAWVTTGKDNVARPQVADFLQRAIGYGATGSAAEEMLVLMFGGGANGKSTLLNVTRGVLGDDYAWRADRDLLSPREGSHTSMVLDLKGRRFVTSIEGKKDQPIDDRQFKIVASADPIAARKMYGNNENFLPTHTIFYATNNRPVIHDASNGMWRRIHLVSFDQTIADDQKDTKYADNVVARHGEGVLRWIVEGAVWWCRGGLMVPAEVRAATESYKQSEDELQRFIDAVLEPCAGEVVFQTELHTAYGWWAAAERAKKKGETVLGNEVAERLGVPKKKIRARGKHSMGIEGFRLVNSAETA